MLNSQNSSIQTIGAFEAKTHLSKLLEKIEQGEQFVITKHGRPVAKLVPISNFDPLTARLAIEKIKQFSKHHSLKGLTLKQIINEGRKK